MERASLREMLIPLIPPPVMALALIVAQPDLGQTGVAGHHPAGPALVRRPAACCVRQLAGVGMVVAAVLAVSGGLPSDRVRSWLDPAPTPGFGLPGPAGEIRARQRRVFGDGLGQGTASGTTCPTPQRLHLRHRRRGAGNLVGAIRLLALFGVFAYTGMRIARRSADPFLRLLTGDGRDDVGDRSGVHQRRLRHRPATRHRHPAAADISRVEHQRRQPFS